MGGGLDEHKEVSAGYEIAVLFLPTGNFFMACVIEDDVSPSEDDAGVVDIQLVASTSTNRRSNHIGLSVCVCVAE